MVTDVSEERSASVFRIKQIEECHLKLGPQKICRGFVPVVDSCFWLGGVRRLQWDDDSDVEAGYEILSALDVHARCHEVGKETLVEGYLMKWNTVCVWLSCAR
jgi:hypothetical protein